MSRITLQTMRHLLDAIVLITAFVAAFMFRFDGQIPADMLKRMVLMAPYVIALQFLGLVFRGVHRRPWRYIGLGDAQRIFFTIALTTSLVVVLRLGAPLLVEDFPRLRHTIIPLGVLGIDAMLAFLGLVGIRVLWRLRIEHAASRTRALQSGQTDQVRTLLVGAGSAGVQVVRELARHPEMGMKPVGFLDDNRNKRGAVIEGIEVLGALDDVARVARATDAQRVLIAIARASGQAIRRVVDACEDLSLEVKIIPGIYEIIDGRVEMNSIRSVSIEDLLGREAVSLDEEAMREFISGRTIAVTGAGGSIGSELCRQVARLAPAKLILIERAEPSLFTVHRELEMDYPDVPKIAAICDVADSERVTALMETHRPQVVFHAAAHKHVPLMEMNPGEAIKNNVFGTLNVARIASEAGAETFVLVSTDKAVNPTSIMGATKRVAEVALQCLGEESDTRFVAVRFGNVLGSAGSVIPIFQEQIKQGGPVTVTHRDMTRYFMTIPEASQLVMQASAMGNGGEIFVLDMGEPVRILDLARDLIRLSGLEPEVDIPIQVTGIRPGEKLFEEIGFHAEQMTKTRHPKIFIGKLGVVAPDEVQLGLERLRQNLQATERHQVMKALAVLVPEMDQVQRPPSATSEEVA